MMKSIGKQSKRVMIVLDANAVLEILELRRFYQPVLKSIKKYENQGVEMAVSALTASTVFYLSERHKIPLERTETLLKQYKIFDVLAQDVMWAFDNYQGKDFEDALQVATATREKCSAFLTIDKTLYTKYRHQCPIELIR